MALLRSDGLFPRCGPQSVPPAPPKTASNPTSNPGDNRSFDSANRPVLPVVAFAVAAQPGTAVGEYGYAIQRESMSAKKSHLICTSQQVTLSIEHVAGQSPMRVK